MNIARFLRIVILKNICERLLLYLTDFLEQLVFSEAIFQNSFSKIFFKFYFTFVSLYNFFHLLSWFSSYSQVKLFVYKLMWRTYLFTFTQKKSFRTRNYHSLPTGESAISRNIKFFYFNFVIT